MKLPVDLHTLKVPEVEDAGKLKVGAARVKITPPVGIRMASVGSNSEGILDDIYVRVIVLQQEDRDQIVWMHIDNLYVPGRNEVPPILQERLGIKPENCFWSASHNHNSGAAWSNKQFNQQIIDAFVQGAEEARRNMKPVRVGIATTHAKFNYNRVMKGDDGKYYGMLDMKQNGFLMDSRPTDTQLAMLWFVDATDHPVACVLYYTGHPNMLCRVLPWISGDWSGWTERLLEDASGAVVMHVNGSLGDVDMRGNSISVDRCIRAGWDVAYTGMQATQQRLTAVDPSSMAGVRVLHAESRGSPNAKAAKKGVASHTLKVRTLTLGPIAFVDVGGELWSRFGLEIRSSSPFPYTYINFSAGYYYPEEWAFAQGSYGTKDRRPDWGGILRDTAVQLLKRAARE